MMKKTMMMLLCGLMFSLAGSAQTEDSTPFFKDKVFLNSSVTGLGLNYNKTQKWNLGATFKGGYFFEDNWAVTGQLGFEYHQEAPNAFIGGVGLRYYFEQNGIYIGAGMNYVHENHNYDDFMPTVQVGYAFFLNRYVTFEPEIYYNQSLKNHCDYSGFGIRMGFSVYFE